ncbi:alpha/beta fold hydrolase [Aquibium sp. LZ166]|uniref:Alpha/beta fold hydrolase n=1 Tax=Aquibium pacificus TaxID=3153579 RepID=A0ABV3SHX1_9HYPH
MHPREKLGKRAGAPRRTRAGARLTQVLPQVADAPHRDIRAESQTGQSETVADDGYRDLDRIYHALLAGQGFGISPISLASAWQDWALHLALSPGKRLELAAKGLEKVERFRGFLAACMADAASKPACITPLPQDRRFDHPGWQAPPFSALSQSFLLWQQWWHNATTGMPGVAAKHERLVEFYGRQFLDMVAPSNFPATNPAVIEKTVRDRGANLVAGFQNWLADFYRLAAQLPPEGIEDFRPGIELAATPGEVVFRNELMELIQYSPSTATVRSEPVLIVPAWIMKYYILDLSPGNSLIRYLVGEGFTVFCISWRNPGREQRDVGFDDYRRHGVMAAIDAVEAISGDGQMHAVGYCLGGTLLSVAAATMARDGDTRLKTLSLFAAQVDFDEPGELGLFIDESQVALIEDVMWKEGYLDQRRMAGAFQMLRSQDLVWSRMVSEYLMGEKPRMNDLMAWNADATRMPYRMHSEYLRQLFLDNDLSQGRFRVEGRPVHVEDIAVPVFAVGTQTDHVAPWRSVFKITHLFDTDVDFVLTNGGHNAGIVAEPGHPHRRYQLLRYRHGDPHPDPASWTSDVAAVEGSWWPAWATWLHGHSGENVAARVAGGSPLYPAICHAPGTYVLQK